MVDMTAGTVTDKPESVGIVMTPGLNCSHIACRSYDWRHGPSEQAFPAGRIRYMVEEAKVDSALTDMRFADKAESFTVQSTDGTICAAAGKEPVGSGPGIRICPHSQYFRHQPHYLPLC